MQDSSLANTRNISSAELEQKLYREFAQVTTVPAYKEMSMYQLLLISQDRLTH